MQSHTPTYLTGSSKLRKRRKTLIGKNQATPLAAPLYRVSSLVFHSNCLASIHGWVRDV